MKKCLMSFLVAGLMIISAINLSSCKKTDTNGNTNMESIPTVYDVITNEDAQRLSKDGGNGGDGEYIDCYYCPDHLMPDSLPYPGGLLYRCDHFPHYNEENHTLFCPVHSHVHYFTATERCTPPGQDNTYFCIYQGLREHRHILTYTSLYFFNGWHIGGGGTSE